MEVSGLLVHPKRCEAESKGFVTSITQTDTLRFSSGESVSPNPFSSLSAPPHGRQLRPGLLLGRQPGRLPAGRSRPQALLYPRPFGLRRHTPQTAIQRHFGLHRARRAD